MDGGRRCCNRQNCPAYRAQEQQREPNEPPAPAPCTAERNSTQILFVEPNFMETPSEYDVFYDCFSDCDLCEGGSGLARVLRSLEEPQGFRGSLKRVACVALKLLKTFDQAARKERICRRCQQARGAGRPQMRVSAHDQPHPQAKAQCQTQSQPPTQSQTQTQVAHVGECSPERLRELLIDSFRISVEPVTLTVPLTVHLHCPHPQLGLGPQRMEPIRTSIISACRPQLAMADPDTGRGEQHTQTDPHRDHEDLNASPRRHDSPPCQHPTCPCYTASATTSASPSAAAGTFSYPSNYRCFKESVGQTPCLKQTPQTSASPSAATTRPCCPPSQSLLPAAGRRSFDVAPYGGPAFGCAPGQPTGPPQYSGQFSMPAPPQYSGQFSTPPIGPGPRTTPRCTCSLHVPEPEPEPEPEPPCHGGCTCRQELEYSSRAVTPVTTDTIGSLPLPPSAPDEEYYSLSSASEEEGGQKSKSRARAAGRRGRQRESPSDARNVIILQLLHEVVHLINEDEARRGRGSCTPQQRIRNLSACCGDESKPDVGAFSSRTNLSSIKITFLPNRRSDNNNNNTSCSCCSRPGTEASEPQMVLGATSLELSCPVGGGGPCNLFITPAMAPMCPAGGRLSPTGSGNHAHVGIEAQSFLNWHPGTETISYDGATEPVICDPEIVEEGTEDGTEVGEATEEEADEGGAPSSQRPSLVAKLAKLCRTPVVVTQVPPPGENDCDCDDDADADADTCESKEATCEEKEQEEATECAEDEDESLVCEEFDEECELEKERRRERRKQKENEGCCCCCHCKAMRAQNGCSTIATPQQALEGGGNSELKYFIDSIIMDLDAMEHARRNKHAQQLRPPANAICPRASFPVTISDVCDLGASSLYVKWTIHDCCGIGGYEIYVDGHLTNRYFHCNHEAAVVCDVDVTQPHKIVLLATPKIEPGCDEVAGDRQNAKALLKKEDSNRRGLPQPTNAVWTPSVYFFDPGSRQQPGVC